MRKLTQYSSPWCKPEPERRQKNGEVQNELCENPPVHIAILARNFNIHVHLASLAPTCTFSSSQVRTIRPYV